MLPGVFLREFRGPNAAAAILVALCACSAKAPAGSIRVQAPGFERPERIVDGQAPLDGSAWDGPLASVAKQPGAHIDLDLGAESKVAALWILADHNDAYQVLGSRDGRSFEPLVTFAAVPEGGLRSRKARGLRTRVRHLRVVPGQGDGAYSVAEFVVFEQDPSRWPPAIARAQAAVPEASLRVLALSVALLCCVLLFALPARLRFSGPLVVVALWLGVGYIALRAAAELPLEPLTISAFRGCLALLAACGVLRQALAHGPSPWTRPLPGLTWLLPSLGLLGFASFFHFGQPQFWDQAQGRPTHVHLFDTQVYQPVAKYFPELGFDGVYFASVAAAIDSDPRLSVESLSPLALRDLRDHRIVTVGEVPEALDEVRQRFSSARWRQFVADTAYFRGALGHDGFFRSLLDHGGNATPLWLTVAHLIFDGRKLDETLLLATALIDPVLLLILFAAIAYRFGMPTAAVCALLFGANDFHMGGNTNWAGATLRHDWMVCLGLGLVALRAGRHSTGGALLALSAFLRAFPFFVFVGIAAAGVGQAWQGYRGASPGERAAAVRVALGPALSVAKGAIIASLLCVALSSSLFSLEMWLLWLHKVGLLSADPHPNHMGLRALFMYDFARDYRAVAEQALQLDWQAVQRETLAARYGWYLLSAVTLSAALLWTCRRQPLHRAALIGLLLFVIWLYPANYYLHIIFLYPLLAEAPRGDTWKSLSPRAAGCWTLLLLCCAAQYLTVLEPYLDAHYLQANLIFGVTLAGVLRLASGDIDRGSLLPVSANRRTAPR
ncbi:MAG: hypothetical protein OEZ06_21715 [Myxococcales bacterium]|nr:hypothetical protein [Myxococcales bacterium]